jgi:hypothetical protein
MHAWLDGLSGVVSIGCPRGSPAAWMRMKRKPFLSFFLSFPRDKFFRLFFMLVVVQFR